MTLSHQCPLHPQYITSCRFLEHDDGVTPNDPGLFNVWLNSAEGKVAVLCANTSPLPDDAKGYLFTDRLYASGRHTIRGYRPDFSRLLFSGDIDGPCLDFGSPDSLRLEGFAIRQLGGTASHLLRIGNLGSTGGDAPDVRIDDVQATTNPLTSNGRPASDNGGHESGVTHAVIEAIGWHQGKISRSGFTNYSNVGIPNTLILDACDQVSINETEIHGFVRSADTVSLRNSGGFVAFRDGLVSNSSPTYFDSQGHVTGYYAPGRAHVAVIGDYGPVLFENQKLYSESGNVPQSCVWQESGQIANWRFRNTAVQASWAVLHGNTGTRIRGLTYGSTEYMATPARLVYKAGWSDTPALIDSAIWANGLPIVAGGPIVNVEVR